MNQDPELEGPRTARLARLATRTDILALRHVHVGPGPTKDSHALTVYFDQKTTPEGTGHLHQWIEAAAAKPATLHVTPADWHTETPHVHKAHRRGDTLLLLLDGLGTRTAYTLRIDDPEGIEARLDPAHSTLRFRLPDPRSNDMDCRTGPSAAPAVAPTIPLPRVTKDYQGFRTALLERLHHLLPGWDETHEADLGITLLELLAYAGDRLSYYQDAVATEAYLETARQRTSVRRHARFVDYQIHDGVSARALIHLAVDHAGTIPAGTQILGRIDVPLGDLTPPHPPELEAATVAPLLDANGVPVFETLRDLHPHPRLNRIRIHTWGMDECSIPAGARSMDLQGDLVDLIHVHDLLMLEQERSPLTGDREDADPNAVWTVRVTRVQRTEDPLEKTPLTRVWWGPGDELRTALTLACRTADGLQLDDITVARGNLALADHGRTVADEIHAGPLPPLDGRPPRPHTLALQKGPLSQCVPPPGLDAPVSALWRLAPHWAEPQILRLQTGQSPGHGAWTVRRDLLSSGPFDPHFVAETDNQGRAHLRFGDGEHGIRPPEQTSITVRYRVGVGEAGNVGAGALCHVVKPTGEALRTWPKFMRTHGAAPGTGDSQNTPEPYQTQDPTPPAPPHAGADAPTAALPKGHFPRPVRNALPAWGGQDPEPIERIKALAPSHFRNHLLVAVTPQDYADIARRNPEVHDARAELRWTGSWTTAVLHIDPKGRAGISPGRRDRIQQHMESMTPVGTTVQILPPTYVALDLDLELRTGPGHAPRDVQKAVREALSTHTLADGTRGYFHPDQFTFGQPVHLSHLYAAIEEVIGVGSVHIRSLRRIDGRNTPHPRTDPPAKIHVRPHEIVRLDNDPARPNHGQIRIHVTEDAP